MKLNPSMPVLTALAVAVFLWCGHPAWAVPASGTPTPDQNITLSTNSGDVELTFRQGSGAISSAKTVAIGGDGISINLSFGSDNPNLTHVNVSNSRNAYDWGPGVIALMSFCPSGEATDISVLPPEYRELWERMEKLVGEVIEQDAFWQLVGPNEDNTAAKTQLEKIRDGWMSPQLFSGAVGVAFRISPRYEVDQQVCRGYDLIGLSDMSVYTPDAVGDEDPLLYVSIGGKYPQDRWMLKINPDTRTCELSWDAGDPTVPLDESDWRPTLDKMRENLLFFLDRIPALTRSGLLKPDDELGLFIERALHGMDAYPIEFIYTRNSGRTVL